MYFSPQRRAIFRHRNFKKCSETVSFLTFWLGNVLLATAACNFSTSQLQKVVWDPKFFNILTCKCASRHSGVQFLNISISKRAPNPSVFLTFWLGNVLLASAACNFSTSQLQKVVWECQLTNWLTDWLIDWLTYYLTSFSTSELQKVREKTQVFCTFWLGNVLLATAACNFSTSELQKMLRDRQFFNVLTCKGASRHSGVQFLNISTSKSAPNPSVF